MKKRLIMATLFALVLFSCKKEKDVISSTSTKQDPTLTKDVSYSNRTIIVPKVDTVIASGVLDTKDAQGMTAIGSNIKFTIAGAFKASEDLSNVYFVVKDGGSVVFTSEKKALVNDVVSSFTQNPFLSFTQAKVYLIEVRADILSSATDNTGVDDQAIVTFDLVYQANGSSTNKTLSFTGQTLTFALTPPPMTFVTSLDATNPTSSVVLDGQDKNTLSYSVKSMGSSANVNEHKFKVQGQAAPAVQSLKLFDGTILIGQAPVVAGTITILGNTLIPENTTKVFTVKAVVSDVYSDISGYDFSIVLDRVSGISLVTNSIASNDTDRVGNNFEVLKAQLEIKKVPVPTLQIVNGAMDLYILDLTAINGDVSLKELAYNILLNDQGFNDTLFAKNFQVLNGSGVDITSQFRFTDVNSNIDTLFSESDSKLRTTRISGTGETIIPNGTTLRLRLRALVGGFNHSLDGDGFSVVPALDVNSSVGLKSLNTGGLVIGNAKLHSNATPNSGAQNFNIVWSDYSSFNHNGLFSQTSNDWLGGKMIIISNITVNNFFQ
jgi:hypothetical protein